MGKFLGGHILLVFSWIKVLFITILEFEGLHGDTYIICSYKIYTAKVIQGK